MKTAQYWIDHLNLQTHPEGGYFFENYRSEEFIDGDSVPDRYGSKRCFGTTIYFMLKTDQKSKFHRLKSDETWYFHAGSPTIIHMIDHDTGKYSAKRIGLDVEKDENPQVLIRRNHWFAAEVLDKDSYILVGCSVAPGFEFEDFEIGAFDVLNQKFPQHVDLIKKHT